jgi:hypothetical protein
MALRHRVGWDPQFVRRSPWFWPLAAVAERFAAHTGWPTHADLDGMYRALCAARPELAALRFTPNVRKRDKRAEGRVRLDQLYDARISVHGEVPTREGDWHDFLNALCFATFPLAKRALHARQYDVLQGRVPAAATRLPSARTREQDALTLFDEGGAVIAADANAYQQLASAPEPERGPRLREACDAGHARVVPFGHALFEHLVEGLRCPGGFTQLIAFDEVALPDAVLLAAVDLKLAQRLADRGAFQTPRAGSHLRLDTLGLWGERGRMVS